WDHPIKGKGRFVLQDPVTKSYTISSPYLERKKDRCTDKELAQEEYGEDLEAGDTFFELSLIDKHIALFARPPKSSWNIKLKDKI
ncbi:MAG: hypothetical protein GTO20_03820, partial [Candidatus Aminicenantes bacterium]|nr:hypothetical protein [Candidatus Aminicenantes bacterium]